MSYAGQTARYLENEVLTRSPEWLVPLLYEHLLVNLRRAALHGEVGDREARADCLDRASSILGELLVSLDRDGGSEFADRLSGLYAYFAIELLELHRSDDAERLGKLIELITELHEAWVAAAEELAPRGTTGAAGSAA